jgi:hypothetical protein
MQTFSKSISKSFLLLFLVSVFSLSPFLSIAEDLSITAEVTGGTTGGTTGGSGGGGGGQQIPR